MQKFYQPLGQWNKKQVESWVVDLMQEVSNNWKVSIILQTIVAPVTNPNTIQILLTLMCIHPKWIAEIINVEGVFLQGEVKNGEIMYIDVPDGVEKYYRKQEDVLLLLNIPIWNKASCFMFLQDSCETNEESRVQKV